MRKNAPFLILLILVSIAVPGIPGEKLQVTPIKSLGKYGAKSVCDSYQEQNNRNGARQICQIK